MSSIFSNPLGGSSNQSTSSSSNQAFPLISSALSPTVANGTSAGNQLSSLLGLNGSPAQNQGFSNFQNSTGYQFGLNQGMQSINGSAATQGLLNSGGNEKALQTYGQNYANTQYGNYTGMLQSLLGSGVSAAGTIGNAGNVFNSQSTGTSSGSVFGGGQNQGSLAGSAQSLLKPA
jgi:hypothetical protein